MLIEITCTHCGSSDIVKSDGRKIEPSNCANCGMKLSIPLESEMRIVDYDCH